MRDAQRKLTRGDQHPATDSAEFLDDTSVLRHLEADLGSDEDRSRIVGIGNGLLAGAAVWLVIIIAATLLF